jgi:hypothetical protein
LSEPGGVRLRLIYKNGGKTKEVSPSPGGFGSTIYDQFSWRLYGRNLVYIENRLEEKGTRFQLKVYSEIHGNTVIGTNFWYWKIMADDSGITCHRYQNGDAKDDPEPRRFSADYLRGL